jgi:propionyl-CoA synthetase
MEEVIAGHPDVAECAVIGVADDFKGQLPLGFVVLKAGVKKDPQEVVKDLVRMIREQIGALASFKHALVVKRLPKTRSGKVLRGTMRKVADGVPYSTPSTIDDPAILDEIAQLLQGLGYGKK